MLGILDRSLLAQGGTGIPCPPCARGAQVRVSARIPTAVPGTKLRFAKALRPLLGWLGGAKPLQLFSGRIGVVRKAFRPFVV